MSIKSYKDAINEALLQEMKKDENVVIMGEDVAGGAGTNGEQDAWGGVLGVTKGLLGLFHPFKVVNCSSSSISARPGISFTAALYTRSLYLTMAARNS